MANQIKSKAQELFEKMGKPKHIGSLESALEESAFVPFTANVIQGVGINHQGLNVHINYGPLLDYVEQGKGVFGVDTKNEVLPLIVNTIFWTSLDNAFYNIEGGTAGEIDEGNPTYGVDQNLGFNYKFEFSQLDSGNFGIETIEFMKNDNYAGKIDNLDLIAAYAEHLRRAI
ncbi:hypothetical protein CMI37_37650 [Candidatus Pacearchaeota archaeon]|nr:hypothetical protein [Candidatus Pacearchaeota archaeon]|tara:strand:- start:4570 stop:5085 length:516 start_codon:yes stop_codon:yes gene_type:complete